MSTVLIANQAAPGNTRERINQISDCVSRICSSKGERGAVLTHAYLFLIRGGVPLSFSTDEGTRDNQLKAAQLFKECGIVQEDIAAINNARSEVYAEISGAISSRNKVANIMSAASVSAPELPERAALLTEAYRLFVSGSVGGGSVFSDASPHAKAEKLIRDCGLTREDLPQLGTANSIAQAALIEQIRQRAKQNAVNEFLPYDLLLDGPRQ